MKTTERVIERVTSNRIVKVIRLGNNCWHWQGVAPSINSNINKAIEDEKRLATFQYPNSQVFVVSVCFN